MSAFAGIVDLRGCPDPGRGPDPLGLDRILGALAFAGPDGSRAWRGRGAALGALRRLALPEDVFDRQPEIGRDRRVAVAVGRVDDRDALAAALGDHRPRSDAGVLLARFRRQGPAAVETIPGDWALAVWDPGPRRLTLMIDRLGMCPVFYHRSGSRLVFATNLGGLLAHPGVPVDLDDEVLADRLALDLHAGSRTCYRGIHRLEPASILVADSDGVRIRRYWEPDSDHEVRLPSDQAYRERFLELLEQAVRRRLRTRGRAGAFLSGGLDSGGIAGVAARQLRGRDRTLDTFTTVPPPNFEIWPGVDRRKVDETDYARAVQELHPNMVGHFLDFAGEAPFDVDRETFRITHQPPLNAFNNIWIHGTFAEAARRGVRVLLGGIAGNLAMSYDGSHHLPGLALSGRWGVLFRWLKRNAALRGTSLAWVTRTYVLNHLLPVPLVGWMNRRDPGERFPWSGFSALSDAAAVDLGVAQRQRARGRDHTLRWGRDPRRSRWGLIQEVGAELGLLRSAYRDALGVELVEPSLDLDLIEFCMALPFDQVSRDGMERRLMRQAMEGLLPDLVRLRVTRGQQMPDYFDRLDRDRIAAELEAARDSARARRLIDLDRCRGLLEDWPEDRWRWFTEHERRFWSYRILLGRGLMVSRFVGWAEGSNRMAT